jgi:uncharacterized protein (UPF0303 family)
MMFNHTRLFFIDLGGTMETNGEHKRVKKEFVSAYFKASFRLCMKRLDILTNISALLIT